MTEFPSSAAKCSFGSVLVWGLLALLGLVALAVLTILPLPWKEQAIFGGVVIGIAVFLNGVSRAKVATIGFIVIWVFSTIRYGYWRVTETWNGITGAGHLHQWDTVVVLVLLFAEFHAFVTLLLGYLQTLRPLRRRPLPLVGDREKWPTVDVFIPTYNEPLSVVRATVLGALALDYPADKCKVFLLDDGHRPEFADFALA